jgi:hypothetical protein
VSQAYTNRFNTGNVTLNISDTDFSNPGDGGVINIDDVNNLTVNVSNSIFNAGSGNINDSAFELKDKVDTIHKLLSEKENEE